MGRRRAAVKNLLHLIRIGEASGRDVILGISSLPQHDTTKMLRVQLHVGLNQRGHLSGAQVEARLSSSSLSSRKTNEQLGLRVAAGLDDIDPFAKVEAASALDKVPGRASSGVVELHPDEIEERVGDGIAELLIGDLALRSTRDVERLVRVLGEVGSQTVDHGRVVYLKRG